jgi:hypothetical protein
MSTASTKLTTPPKGNRRTNKESRHIRNFECRTLERQLRIYGANVYAATIPATPAPLKPDTDSVHDETEVHISSLPFLVVPMGGKVTA